MKERIDELIGLGIESENASRIDTEIEILQSRMKFEDVSFSFRKKDGTLRQAVGTLRKDVCDNNIAGTANQGAMKNNANPLIIVYYDVEAKGWRCFKAENFIGIN